MKLYLIHVGFYDPNIMDGLYEQHANYFVVAENVKDAKKQAKQNSIYKKKKMHIDGIQELTIIDGYQIKLERNDSIDSTDSYSYDVVKINEVDPDHETALEVAISEGAGWLVELLLPLGASENESLSDIMHNKMQTLVSEDFFVP